MKWIGTERWIRRLFLLYGKVIYRHPIPFIVLPVICTVILSGGFAFLTVINDVEYLFTPINSQFRKDQVRLQEEFADVKMYNPSRSLELDIIGRVIIINKTPGGSIWDQESLDEIFDLDNFINSLSVGELGYTDVCMTSSDNGSCISSGLELLKSTRTLKYPIHEVVTVPSNHSVKMFLGFLLGGVTTDEDEWILDVKALQLVYYLQNSDDGKAWVNEFNARVGARTLSRVNVERWTYFSIGAELSASSRSIIPYVSISLTMLIFFTIFATMDRDPVRAKPWFGLCGILSACLAMVSASGLLMYCGVPCTNTVAVAPFLVMGIGVDDMFVMLAAWRKTDHTMKTEERMPEAFSEAAVAITITSVTDVLGLCMGVANPFPAVQIFCAYTALMIFMGYVFQITFCAACMVLSGQREESNKHAWTCLEVPTKPDACVPAPHSRLHVVPPQCSVIHISIGESVHNRCCLLCCTDGISGTMIDGTPSQEEEEDVWLMALFRDRFATMINKNQCKLVIMAMMMMYFGASIFGCTTLQQGLEFKKLAPDRSDIMPFYVQEELYFRRYGFSVQIIVHTDLSKRSKINRVDELIGELEDSKYFSKSFTTSWLKSYRMFSNTDHIIDYSDLFGIHFEQFLQNPVFSVYSADVLRNKNIYRFFVMSEPLYGTEGEVDVMLTSREIAAKYPDIDVVAYNPRFVFTEQFVAVLPNTVLTMGYAVVCMTVISLFLIPSLVMAVWTTVTIISICIGVVGFMSLWDVSLDTISMINLIMCIGFCVDFAAHISYAFVSSARLTRQEHTADALFAVGLPIVQGSLSTIICILPLAASMAYVFRTLFKVMFLFILFGMLHGLFVLPALLSFMGPLGGRVRVLSVGEVGIDGRRHQLIIPDITITGPDGRLL